MITTWSSSGNILNPENYKNGINYTPSSDIIHFGNLHKKNGNLTKMIATVISWKFLKKFDAHVNASCKYYLLSQLGRSNNKVYHPRMEQGIK